MTRAAALVSLALLAVCGCGRSTDSAPRGKPVAVGRPVAPWRLASPSPGAVEMELTRRDGSHVLLAYTAKPGMDRSDVCFTVALDRESPLEADENCEVRAAGGGVTLFAHTKGPSIVAGYAGPGAQPVMVDGLEVPLSAHGGFLALLPRGTRPRITPAPRARTRRPGAVFDDEVGESVMRLGEEQLLRRFGEPAAREGGCLRYDLVGHPGRGFTFCFDRGRMTRAYGYGY